jgi:hypothetical protein
MTNRFSNLKATKKHKFISVEVEMCKLSTADVLEIQEQSKKLGEGGTDKDNIDLMLSVIRKGVAEMKDMTDEELLDLPMEDLSTLSAEIMKFSGLGKGQ